MCLIITGYDVIQDSIDLIFFWINLGINNPACFSTPLQVMCMVFNSVFVTNMMSMEVNWCNYTMMVCCMMFLISHTNFW